MLTRADIYLSLVGSAHNTASNGVYIAIASTIIETSVPSREVTPALQLLGGAVIDKWVEGKLNLNPSCGADHPGSRASSLCTPPRRMAPTTASLLPR